MKTNWEKEFEKFWLELSDTRKWKNGKPVVGGYLYVTTGNAVMQFIKETRHQAILETIEKVEKEVIGGKLKLDSKKGRTKSQIEWEEIMVTSYNQAISDLEFRLSALKKEGITNQVKKEEK